MTYAAHALYLTQTYIKTMESAHGNIIKSSLGLSKYSRTSPLIASLNVQRVESVINNQTINLLRRYLMGDSLASQLYWTLYKQGELDDKTLLGRASHLIHKNELTFTKTIFNDIFHINTKSVGEGRPKWAPEVKWATPITANLVNAMAKIMMLVSNPSREGTMECVAYELQHKIKQ